MLLATLCSLAVGVWVYYAAYDPASLDPAKELRVLPIPADAHGIVHDVDMAPVWIGGPFGGGLVILPTTARLRYETELEPVQVYAFYSATLSSTSIATPPLHSALT